MNYSKSWDGLEAAASSRATPSSGRILLRNATKSFGRNKNVLGGLDLEVRPGCVYALLGASGCGKTTALSAAVGRIKLDKGTARVSSEKNLLH